MISYGIGKGRHYFVGSRAKLRPWLQAISMGAVYDGTKIRAQIDAAEEGGADGAQEEGGEDDADDRLDG